MTPHPRRAMPLCFIAVLASTLFAFEPLAWAQAGWSAAASTVFSTKGTNYAVIPPGTAGQAARLTSFSATTTDADDWLVFYKTGAETTIALTNLAVTTNLIVVSTNGLFAGDLIAIYSATGKVWSVERIGGVWRTYLTNAASVTYSNQVLIMTNAINYGISQNPLRAGDKIYRLVQYGKMGLAAPVTTFGLTNAQGGWTYVQRDGDFWVGDGGKPAVLVLRDESPGAAIVAGECTNTIHHAAGTYIPANTY